MEKIIGQTSDSCDVRNRDRTLPECYTTDQEVTLNVATTPQHILFLDLLGYDEVGFIANCRT